MSDKAKADRMIVEGMGKCFGDMGIVRKGMGDYSMMGVAVWGKGTCRASIVVVPLRK